MALTTKAWCHNVNVTTLIEWWPQSGSAEPEESLAVWLWDVRLCCHSFWVWHTPSHSGLCPDYFSSRPLVLFHPQWTCFPPSASASIGPYLAGIYLYTSATSALVSLPGAVAVLKHSDQDHGLWNQPGFKFRLHPLLAARVVASYSISLCLDLWNGRIIAPSISLEH